MSKCLICGKEVDWTYVQVWFENELFIVDSFGVDALTDYEQTVYNGKICSPKCYQRLLIDNQTNKNQWEMTIRKYTIYLSVDKNEFGIIGYCKSKGHLDRVINRRVQICGGFFPDNVVNMPNVDKLFYIKQEAFKQVKEIDPDVQSTQIEYIISKKLLENLI